VSTVGQHEVGKNNMHLPRRRKIAIHRSYDTPFLEYGIDGRDLTSNCSPRRNQHLVESVHRLDYRSVDRLSDSAYPYRLIEHNLEGHAGWHR